MGRRKRHGPATGEIAPCSPGWRTAGCTTTEAQASRVARWHRRQRWREIVGPARSRLRGIIETSAANLRARGYRTRGRSGRVRYVENIFFSAGLLEVAPEIDRVRFGRQLAWEVSIVPSETEALSDWLTEAIVAVLEGDVPALPPVDLAITIDRYVWSRAAYDALEREQGARAVRSLQRLVPLALDAERGGWAA